MKKAIALLCTAALTLTFAACGGAASSTASTASASGAETDKPYAGTTLRVLSMTAQVSDGIQEYLDAFEEKTGITVNLELYGETELREKETTEFIAGSSTVDVFLMSPLQDMAAFSKNGWIEPLDTYLTDPELDWNDSHSPHRANHNDGNRFDRLSAALFLSAAYVLSQGRFCGKGLDTA